MAAATTAVSYHLCVVYGWCARYVLLISFRFFFFFFLISFSKNVGLLTPATPPRPPHPYNRAFILADQTRYHS